MSGITPFDVSQQKGIKFESTSLEYLKLYERIYSELKKGMQKHFCMVRSGYFIGLGTIRRL